MCTRLFFEVVGAYARLPKLPLASSCMFVCLRRERRGFHEVWYLSIFRKYIMKIQVSLKSDKNDGYFA